MVYHDETGLTEIQEEETCVETCLSTKEEDTDENVIQETNVLVHREETCAKEDKEVEHKENPHEIKVKRI